MARAKTKPQRSGKTAASSFAVTKRVGKSIRKGAKIKLEVANHPATSDDIPVMPPILNVKVTQYNIDNSDRCHMGSCVFAMALKDAFKRRTGYMPHHVSVYSEQAQVTDQNLHLRYTYIVTGKARRTIELYDEGIDPKPFGFTLGKAGGSVAMTRNDSGRARDPQFSCKVKERKVASIKKKLGSKAASALSGSKKVVSVTKRNFGHIAVVVGGNAEVIPSRKFRVAGRRTVILTPAQRIAGLKRTIANVERARDAAAARPRPRKTK